MNTQTKLSASRLIVMTLACLMAVCLAACGGDDNEPTVDEFLSDKTTPVTFELPQGDYYMFDYSGSRYVGSDTIHVDRSCKFEAELRQGKHHIIWISLGNEDKQFYLQLNWVDNSMDGSPVFDTLTRKILHAGNNRSLGYGMTDIEVSPYLLPIQKVEFEKITACLKIEATDKLPYEPYFDGNYSFKALPGFRKELYYEAYFFGIGMFTDFYLVTLSTDNGSYIIDSESRDIIVGTGAFYFNESPKCYYDYDAQSPIVMTLCPKDGLNDIQLVAEIKEQSGKAVPTTMLPKFSLRRGYTTRLSGPLFSGSTADWTVTMEPY